jgi:HK97 family phage prohead protease
MAMFQTHPGQAFARYLTEQREAREAREAHHRRARDARIQADLICRRLDRALSTPPTSPVETRAASPTTPVVDVNEQRRIITIIAVPWNQRAQVKFRGQVWNELFERGAFDGIDADPERIRVNREHNKADAVGKVVRFDPHDPRGLIADIQVARSSRGDDTLALAADHALSSSVGFRIKAGGEQLDRFTRTRRITSAQLDHIALVMTPAYEGAQILAVRSRGER